MARLVARNLTDFFNKEMLMYSFGDIKLKKPIPVKKLIFIMAGLLAWTFPLWMILNNILDTVFSPLPLIILLVPPFLFGHYATKPVFGGKTMKEFFKAQINFLQQPQGWSDLNVDNDQQNTVYYISSEISISRRRELAYLSQLARQRAEAQGLIKKKNKDYKKAAKQKIGA